MTWRVSTRRLAVKDGQSRNTRIVPGVALEATNAVQRDAEHPLDVRADFGVTTAAGAVVPAWPLLPERSSRAAPL
jgi:hypothetical protein